jgi:hypothetical protein
MSFGSSVKQHNDTVVLRVAFKSTYQPGVKVKQVQMLDWTDPMALVGGRSSVY